MKRAGSTREDLPWVLVVQPLYAHYRYGVLSRLAKSKEYHFAFAAGNDSSDGHIATFEPSVLANARLLQNRWFKHILWQRGVLALLRERRYSALVVTGAANHLSTWALALEARALGVRVLFWTSGWHRPDTGFKRLVRLAFYRLANRLLLYNERSRELGSIAGYPRERMSVIYNSEESPLRDSRVTAHIDGGGATAGAPVVLAVVRLNESKCLDQLIRAADVLRKRSIELRVVLVGEGPEEDALRELARELSVNLELPGAIYDEGSLSKYYASASVTVIPGAVGLTAIQSLRHGVPVVSNADADAQVAEWESIQDGITGGHFSSGDIVGLANEIEVWINAMKADRRGISAQCVREYESKWTAKRHAERIVEGIRATITDPPKGGRLGDVCNE